MSNWAPGTTITGWGTGDPSRYLIADIDGDGKSDLIFIRPDSYIFTLLSTGTGWTQGSPINGYNWGTGDPSRYRIADIDGDGKSDLVFIRPDSYIFTLLSTGTGWTQGSPINGYNWGTGDPSRYLIADIDGDRKSDLVFIRPDSYIFTLLSTGNNNTLSSIIDPHGSTTTITYTPAPQVPNAIINTQQNSVYPSISNNSPRNLVTSISTTDGRGATYSTSYSYSNGKTYMGTPPDQCTLPYRRDLGFEYIIQRNDQTKSYVKTWYEQSKDLAGRVKTVKEFASDGGTDYLMKQTDYVNDAPITKWGPANGKTKFIRLNQEITSTYEMNNMVSTLAYTQTKTYTYGDIDHGNMTQLKDEITGEPGSTVITDIDYYDADEENWIVNRVQQVKKSSSNGAMLQKQRFNYIGNNLMEKQDFLGEQVISTFYDYDAYGNVKYIKDALNYETFITYESDYNTFPKNTTKTVGMVTLVTTQTFDPRFGVKVSDKDANLNETVYKYDEFGRLIGVQEPGDNCADVNLPADDIQHNAQNPPVTINLCTKAIAYVNTGDANLQHTTTFIKDDSPQGYTYQRSYFDGLGREYKNVSKAYQDQTYLYEFAVDKSYNDKGQLWKESNQYVVGVETPLYNIYTYNTAGKISNKSLPDGGNIGITYSASNSSRRLIVNVTQKVDAQTSYTTTSEYNSRGLLAQQTEPENGSVSYEYDPLGRLKTTTVGGAEATSIEYDTMGRKKSILDPNMGTTRYAYDALGRVITKTDAKTYDPNNPNKVTTTYTYDALGRLTLEHSDGYPDVHYEYDTSTNSKGRLSLVDDGTVKTDLSYDVKGNITKKTQKIDNTSYVFLMEYDTQKRLKRLTYPDGKVVRNVYTDSDYLEAVTDDHDLNDSNAHAYVRYVRDVTTYRVIRHTGNNVESVITYNPLNHLPNSLITKSYKQIVDTQPAIFENMTFAHDLRGNVTQITDNLITPGARGYNQIFAYDGMGRLKTATGGFYPDKCDANNTSYSYNSRGNLLTKDGITLNYTAPGNTGQPYAVKSDSTGNQYQYDKNGNMTGRKNKTLAYDYKNRLISISDGTTTLETYTYDHTGMRVKRQKSDGTIVYSFSGLFDFINLPGGGTQYIKYIHGLDGDLVAQMKSPTATLIADNKFIDGMYVSNPIIAFSCRALYALDRFMSNAKNYNRFIMVLFAILALSLLGSTAWFRIRRRGGIEFRYRWVSNLAPLVILIFLFSAGFTGCFLPDSNDVAEYFHPDFVGSVKYVTNIDGAKIAEYNYDPYGKLLADHSTGMDVSKYRYTSQQDDGDLYYYKARYYDAGIGRFITPDNVVPDAKSSQAYNRYMYVKGDPIDLGDPTGHWLGKLLHHIKHIAKKAVDTTVGAVVNAVAGAYAGMLAGVQAGMYGGLAGVLLGGIIGAMTGAAVGAAVGGYIGYKYGMDHAVGMAYYMGVYATTGFGLGMLYGGGLGGAAITLQMAIGGSMMGERLGIKTIVGNPGLLLAAPVYNIGYNEKTGKWDWDTFKGGDLCTNFWHMPIGLGLNVLCPGSGCLLGAALEIDQCFGISAKCSIDAKYWFDYCIEGSDASKYKDQGISGDDHEEAHTFDRGRDLTTWSF